MLAWRLESWSASLLDRDCCFEFRVRESDVEVVWAECRRRLRALRRVLRLLVMREMLDRSDWVWKFAVVWRISWGKG